MTEKGVIGRVYELTEKGKLWAKYGNEIKGLMEIVETMIVLEFRVASLEKRIENLEKEIHKIKRRFAK